MSQGDRSEPKLTPNNFTKANTKFDLVDGMWVAKSGLSTSSGESGVKVAEAVGDVLPLEGGPSLPAPLGLSHLATTFSGNCFYVYCYYVVWKVEGKPDLGSTIWVSCSSDLRSSSSWSGLLSLLPNGCYQESKSKLGRAECLIGALGLYHQQRRQFGCSLHPTIRVIAGRTATSPRASFALDLEDVSVGPQPAAGPDPFSPST